MLKKRLNYIGFILFQHSVKADVKSQIFNSSLSLSLSHFLSLSPYDSLPLSLTLFLAADQQLLKLKLFTTPDTHTHTDAHKVVFVSNLSCAPISSTSRWTCETNLRKWSAVDVGCENASIFVVCQQIITSMMLLLIVSRREETNLRVIYIDLWSCNIKMVKHLWGLHPGHVSKYNNVLAPESSH